jgi:ABC-2 type transport system ATP-binding protein
MSSPMIEARGIEKSFGTTRALDGVAFAAETGRILALLGPNGAGKTTLVRILTTLLQPDAGWARVAGLDTVRDAAAVRSVIGLSGQFAAIDDLLTGRENLQMVGELYHLTGRDARNRAKGLLEQFGLDEAADRLAKTYSGGMRRRLDLAASLIARPPVLVLDEPTTGLDPRTRLDMWNAIDELATEGATVLLTTQYLEDAERLAHYLVVIDRGRVIAEGTTDQLKDMLGGDVIELRVPEGTLIDDVVRAVEPTGDGSMVLDRDRQRITLPATVGSSTLRAVLQRLDDAGLVVHDIGIRRPSLDDVFLSLTGHGAEDAERDNGPRTDGSDRLRKSS